MSTEALLYALATIIDAAVAEAALASATSRQSQPAEATKPKQRPSFGNEALRKSFSGLGLGTEAQDLTPAERVATLGDGALAHAWRATAAAMDAEETLVAVAAAAAMASVGGSVGSASFSRRSSFDIGSGGSGGGEHHHAQFQRPSASGCAASVYGACVDEPQLSALLSRLGVTPALARGLSYNCMLRIGVPEREVDVRAGRLRHE
jgi:hypothetical protein